jgi:oligopeptide transport system substrate-binding protein
MIAGQANEISGVKVVNDYTLQVTIDAPKSYFLSKMAYPTTMVVDKDNVATGVDWWRQPNGSGPFKLKEWQQSSLLVLERNDSYYGDVASLEFVEFQMYTGDEMSLYETGEIDVANVYASTIDRATDPSGPFHDQYHVSPQLSFSWLGFNTNEPPFDDLDVRKAFSMAIDKDKIISLSMRNLVQRADGILPPGMPGYNENLVGLDYDVTQAKALIASSKYGSVANLPPVVLTVSGYGGAISPVLEAIIVQWRENLGVEVTVRQLETDFYLYHLKEEVDSMYYMGWIADYPHPQDFLDVLFHTGMQYNYGGYSNSAIDNILEQAAIEQDNAKSLTLYQQAEQMLIDDAAMIPLWFGQTIILVKPYVEGYQPNALGNVMFNKVKIYEH